MRPLETHASASKAGPANGDGKCFSGLSAAAKGHGRPGGPNRLSYRRRQVGMPGLLPRSGPAMRRAWCLVDEGFRQELLQRWEGKLGDHDSGELPVRLRKETTLPVKTIAARMHLGTSKSVNARLYGQMRQSVPVTSASAQAQLEI